MTYPTLKLKTITLLFFASISLSACIPVSETNSGGSNLAYSYVLPYQPGANDSLIYFVQPYSYQDVVFLGGALSDSGKGYYSSELYLQPVSGQQKKYIGKMSLGGKTLCTRVSPGNYTILVTSLRATPALLRESVTISAHQTYVYALNTQAPSWKTGTINIEKMSVEQGKSYIKQQPPVACP